MVLLFTNCEDTKKVSSSEVIDNVEESSKELVIDSVAIESDISSDKKESVEESNLYPKITNENVISFFSEYGIKNPETKVKISTFHGDIIIQLYQDTPIHRANFIYLVKQGYFENTFFYRIVPNFIIQGGNSDNKDTPKKRSVIGNDYLLPSEVISGRNHRYGTVSGAKEYRKNPDKKSFPFEFFIFLGPIKHTKHLNGDYTIFGKVIKGMDVVEKIANLPADNGEWPLDNVYISAEVID